MEEINIKNEGAKTNRKSLSKLFHFSFPETVNEKAARSVAGMVAIMSGIALLTGYYWILALLAFGFWLRVGYGPRFSPFALLATKIIAPRLGVERICPGPPKRFAQTIGAIITTGATLLVFTFSVESAGAIAAFIMLVFASLESILGICVGCKIFSLLMKTGLVPEEVCLACQDFRQH